ncbi:MAG: GNAT family N-acetyltransferase [Oscillochloris sp.]|nr:GNAT family N-acetyltransferase [Oscillochloris sp.]
MIYRALTSADRAAYIALESYAFPVNPDRAGESFDTGGQFRGLFVDDLLVAQLEILPLAVELGNGATIAAGGIGSVAGDPTTRRRGYVATMMRHAMDELRERNLPLCILYPFKRSFYGRYGWATFVERRVYSGPPALFAPFRSYSGRFVAAGEAEIAELDQIYRGALRGRFGPIRRDHEWWRKRVLHDWQGKRRHAFIWRDPQGRGRSYLIFALEHEGDTQRMALREVVALDPEARAALFGFMSGHEDQIRQIEFRAPGDAPVSLLFPDPPDCRLEPHFMLRLLDVAAALEQLPYSADLHGRLTIAVSDPWLRENQGSYELEFAAGRAQVRRVADDAPAQVRCDVGPLAQIISRHLRPRTAAAFGVISAEREALRLLDRAFSGLPPFCSDFFLVSCLY